MLLHKIFSILSIKNIIFNLKKLKNIYPITKKKNIQKKKMDDIENNMISDDKPESSNNLFPLSQFKIPNIQAKIEAFSPSQKYIFLLTDHAEIYKINVDDESSFRQAYSLDNLNSI